MQGKDDFYRQTYSVRMALPVISEPYAFLTLIVDGMPYNLLFEKIDSIWKFKASTDMNGFIREGKNKYLPF